jgi:ABC-type polysaccharide/polyol phosphate transport system ATPase subunit
MSSKLLLSARGLTKIYGPPRSTVARLLQSLLRRPPSGKTKAALDGVDVDIRSGETVGIMGPNGAGKTTLLAILGNILPPTSGSVHRFGRISTLLETGSGFHPDMTGRENTELFSAIMGVRRKQSRSYVEWVKDFADVGHYFDAPIRTYSSGMQARLGFACAINVDADLMIVDEALAVGDMQFKRKCYALIQGLQGKGRSFLIVSHSPHLVLQFCSRAVVLDRGRKVFDGAAAEGATKYRELLDAGDETVHAIARLFPLQQVDAPLFLKGAVSTSRAESGEDLVQMVTLTVGARIYIARPALRGQLQNHRGVAVCGVASDAMEPLGPGEERQVKLAFTQRLLSGTYFLEMMAGELLDDGAFKPVQKYDHLVRFDVVRPSQLHGIVDLDMNIEITATQG